MDLKRRLQLYLIGLILGGLMAWGFFGNRLSNTAWMPEDRIKLRLKSTLLKAHPNAEAQMARWPTDLNAVRASIDSAEVLIFKLKYSINNKTFINSKLPIIKYWYKYNKYDRIIIIK